MTRTRLLIHASRLQQQRRPRLPRLGQAPVKAPQAARAAGARLA